jgi:hypothetical protein
MTRLITLSFLAVTVAAGVTVVNAGHSAAQTQVRDHRGPAHGSRTNPASMPGGVDVRPHPFQNVRDGRPRAKVRLAPRR